MIFFILFLILYVSYAFQHTINNRSLNKQVIVQIKNKVYEYELPMWVENDIFQQNILQYDNANIEKVSNKNIKKNKKVYRKFPKIVDDDYEIPSWVYNKVFKSNIPGAFKNKQQTLRNLDRML